jgi:hypothetical protein
MRTPLLPGIKSPASGFRVDAKISVCRGVGGMFAASSMIIMSNEAL